MRKHVGAKGTAISGLVIAAIVLGAVAATPLLSRAAKREVVSAPQMTLTVVNNSSREIRHLYFSPPDQDNWGPDQLGSTIAAGGGSATVNNVSCSGAGTKAIAEDQNGCFVYHVVECGDSASWTITNEAAPDCGN
jgi:hypothetical protein